MKGSVVTILFCSVLAAVCAWRALGTLFVVCTPPCKNGEMICTWKDGGNGFNGSSCQHACGPPVGDGSACKLSANKTCYWGHTEKSMVYACFSGPIPCSPDKEIIDTSFLTCAEWQKDYGGCKWTSGHGCDPCCSGNCHCIHLGEDEKKVSACVCDWKKVGLHVKIATSWRVADLHNKFMTLLTFWFTFSISIDNIYGIIEVVCDQL